MRSKYLTDEKHRSPEGSGSKYTHSGGGGESDGRQWLGSFSKPDINLLYRSFSVADNYTLDSEPVFRQVFDELGEQLKDPTTVMARPSRAGNLKDLQRDQPFLYMLRNVNHRREIDALVVVLASCHRYMNRGYSPTVFVTTPKDPEGALRKSVTTGRGNRAISKTDMPYVISVIQSVNSFDDLFIRIDRLSGNGKTSRSKSSAEVFFTRVQLFADGLSQSPAVSESGFRDRINPEHLVDTCEQQVIFVGDSANAASHSIQKIIDSKSSTKKKAKEKRENSLWLNRLLIATTSWNSSVRSPAERGLLGKYFRGLAEDLSKIKSWGKGDPISMQIDVILLISIVLAKHPLMVAKSTISELGIDLSNLSVRKTIRYPKNYFKPKGADTEKYVATLEDLELLIPTILSNILKHLFRLDLIDPDFRIEDHFMACGLKIKKTMKSRIRELADELGMPRIGLDQFAQQLVLYMNDDVGDGDENSICQEATHWQIFCILGAKNHLPPVGSHYEAVSDTTLSAAHERSTENYFEGRA
jgi:hypothetical protein